jgi:PAS domain S-box-containing protein
VADSVADPDDFAEKVLDTYADNSYVERFDCRIGAGDGRAERWLEHYSRPIESGQYKGGRIELYYDITERKRSEVALRETEERFRSLVDAVEEYAIFRLDPEGHVISWNEGAKEIKGYESVEILGEHFSQFYTEEDRAAGVPEQSLGKATERGSVEDEGWRVREDGSQFWANVTITEVRDEDGTHRGYLKVTRDMTDRREYEQQLEDQADHLEQQRDELEEELDNVFERIDDGFYALDDEFQFNYVNETAEEYLGKSADELIGRNYVDVIDVDEDDPLQGTFERSMATQESTSFERYAAALGMWAIVRVYPSSTGLSVYFRDISERKQLQSSLQRTTERLETIVEARDAVGIEPPAITVIGDVAGTRERVVDFLTTTHD